MSTQRIVGTYLRDEDGGWQEEKGKVEAYHSGETMSREGKVWAIFIPIDDSFAVAVEDTRTFERPDFCTHCQSEIDWYRQVHGEDCYYLGDCGCSDLSDEGFAWRFTEGMPEWSEECDFT